MLMIGCGGVGKALLELNIICKFLPFSICQEIDIVEPEDLGNFPFYDYYIIHHYQIGITKSNIKKVLIPLLKRKKIVVDVSVNINALEIMKLCHRYNIMYVNTSLENWELNNPSEISKIPRVLYTRTLYNQYQKLRKLFGLGNRNKPTMVFDHGMNPGLISHLAKCAIEDAYLSIYGKMMNGSIQKRCQKMTKKMEIHTIQIAEMDTQKANFELKDDTFYNTWSPMGFIAEGLDPIQVGYKPDQGHINKILGPGLTPPEGEKNIRFYPIRGIDQKIQSLVLSPKGIQTKFKGFMIPHGEANTLSLYLTYENTRPDVYYVYLPSFPARKSINDMKKNKYVAPSLSHPVLTIPELKDIGYDSIGAYLIGDKINWWTGTVLTVRDVKNLGIKYAGPTEIQVAISLLSCIKWMLRNPKRGVLSPEYLPHRTIVKWCTPYLGRYISQRVDAI